MKIFGFVNKVLFVGLAILSDLTNESSLSSISVSNQIILYFTLLVLTQVNVVAINDPMQLTVN